MRLRGTAKRKREIKKRFDDRKSAFTPGRRQSNSPYPEKVSEYGLLAAKQRPPTVRPGLGIRPGNGSLPGCAYFLMNTRGSTTQRLNKVAKTAPAAMISITSSRSSNWILPASIPPKCYQRFNKVLILCYIPAHRNRHSHESGNPERPGTLTAPKSTPYRNRHPPESRKPDSPNRHSHESGNPDQPGTLPAQD